MTRLLLIMLGGGAGTGLRYGIYLGMKRLLPHFPYGTLAVNLLGCFLAGLLGALFFAATNVREELRWAIMIGFLGGLTTFSSYAYDTLNLWIDKHTTAAFMNIIVNNVAGLLLVGLGYWLGTRWTGMPVA